MFTYTNIMSTRRCYRTKSLHLIIYGADLSSFIHYPSPLAIPHLYPHTLTPTLTTKTTINRAFQTNCGGVRVEKEFRPVRLKWLSGHLEFHTPAAIQFSNSPLILAAVMIAKAPLPDFDHDIPLWFWRVATTGISHSL